MRKENDVAILILTTHCEHDRIIETFPVSKLILRHHQIFDFMRVSKYDRYNKRQNINQLNYVYIPPVEQNESSTNFSTESKKPFRNKPARGLTHCLLLPSHPLGQIKIHGQKIAGKYF